MVVSTERHASQARVETLKAGGNAIDAAVATAFTMAVSYPSCGNICGEGFMLYHGKDVHEAVCSKRIHHGWMPDYTIIEGGAAIEEALDEYKNMGHKVFDCDTCRELGVEYSPPSLGTAMCIQIDWENQVFYGAANPRSGDPSAFPV